MNQYFFTFGQAHTHPETGEAMKDYFLEIHAHSADAATDYMISRFGYKWSGMYSPKTFRREFFPKGRYGEVIEIFQLQKL